MKRILILGGGGNASVIGYAILDASIRGQSDLEFCGFINDRDNVGEIEGYPVFGGLKDIPGLLDSGFFFINSIGKIGHQKNRIELIDSLPIPPERWVTFIHPLAYVAPNVMIGHGSVVMPHVSISPGTVIGNHTRIMINAVIGHNNKIGNHCFFAASSCVGAHITIGDGVFISLNSTIREYLTLGNHSTLGMGAVLTKDVGDNEIWVGNPAKCLR